MLKRIYQELVEIRKELHGIRQAVESMTKTRYVLVREPYSSHYKIVELPAEKGGRVDDK